MYIYVSTALVGLGLLNVDVLVKHTILGRNPLDEWSAPGKDRYLKKILTRNRQPAFCENLTHNRSERSAANPPIRPRVHRDWLGNYTEEINCGLFNIVTILGLRNLKFPSTLPVPPLPFHTHTHTHTHTHVRARARKTITRPTIGFRSSWLPIRRFCSFSTSFHSHGITLILCSNRDENDLLPVHHSSCYLCYAVWHTDNIVNKTTTNYKLVLSDWVAAFDRDDREMRYEALHSEALRLLLWFLNDRPRPTLLYVMNSPFYQVLHHFPTSSNHLQCRNFAPFYCDISNC
jgi:hypothetical protein